MIVLKNLSKSFREKEVLKNINVEFKQGLNFIIGPSGSGKTTLLKILSGIDRNYKGKIFIDSKELKFLTEEELNEYHYNSVGFIWQDFKLIEHLTVEENVILPLDLLEVSEEFKKKRVNLILKQLDLDGLANKSVSKLSGGQKQRVSIARAIIKNPDIIIADEPTGALDKNTSEKIMNALRDLSKEKTVIIVTHDKSLVDEYSNCFELKDWSLNQISIGKNIKEKKQSKKMVKPRLSLINSCKRALNNIKGLKLRFIATALILAISSYLVLINVNSTLSNQNNDIFKKLIDERGNTLKNIEISTSAIGSMLTDSEKEETSMEIEQNVSKAFEKYKNDSRVEALIADSSIDNMSVTIDGVVKDYKIESSNSAPVLNEIIEGRLPSLNDKEVAVSKKFLENIGMSNENAIGKKINIKGTIFDWSSGNPVEKEVSIDNATIVGVIDSSVKYVYSNGKTYETELEDSFFYSLSIINTIRGLSNDNKNVSFTLRVKNVEDILPIVDELKSMGITALGEFEEIRDILSMNYSTESQAGALTMILGILAVIIMLTIAIINSYLRKTEIGILKINGYSKGSIFKLTLMEYLIVSVISFIILLILFPIIRNFSPKISIEFSLIQVIKGVIIVIVQALIIGTISSCIYKFIDIEKTLMGSRRG